jgi:hypothetical protein
LLGRELCLLNGVGGWLDFWMVGAIGGFGG